MKRSSIIGYSIYPSTWIEKRKQLSSLFQEGSAVFTSLHISEEMNEGYVTKVEAMVEFLKSTGYEIIADVSRRSLEVFGEDSLASLARRLRIDVLRIDYGFSEEEMLEAAREVAICLNASTLTEDTAKRLKDTGHEFFAMHNYYPRPETGLDADQFQAKNEMLRSYGIDVMAFIMGDDSLRGPLHEGLPTLEEHRGVSPYVAFVDMQNTYKIRHIFMGDGLVTEPVARLIQRVITQGVYPIPAELQDMNENLYDQVFTVRTDSPKSLMRLQESREYATQGEIITPRNTVERQKGSITMDNADYKRYSGEIQILRTDFGADSRVNVIGHVLHPYLGLLSLIPNDSKIVLVRA